MDAKRQLARSTVARLREQLDRRELTAAALAGHFLDRIRVENERLMALVAWDEEQVLTDAQRADEQIENGISAPLLGIPVTIKDALDTTELPAHSGSVARRQAEVADAVVVDRIRAAGGIIFGKTNMPELGTDYETNNVRDGRTSNPLDVTRTPGGSSGGEAAAIAAGMSPLGVGTDGGGSIRVPAHYCGVLGLRPTVGRVPTTGSWPGGRASATLDLTCVGPMARSTEDLALLLRVIHGADHGDPFTHPVPLRDWRHVDVAGLRIGWYLDDGLASAGPASIAAVETAADALSNLGAEVVRVEPPEVADATEIFFRLLAADGGRGVADAVGTDPGDHTKQFLELLQHPPHGSSESAHDYFGLLARKHDLRSRVRRWLDRYDAILCPVSPGAAPKHGEPPPGIPPEAYGRYEGFNFTHTYSLAGVPAGTVPSTIEDGLPVGVQAVARAWRDDIVLAVLSAIEHRTGRIALDGPPRPVR